MQQSYCFSKVPIFQNLKTEEMEKISNIITRFEFRKQQLMMVAGSTKKNLFIVREGKAKVSYLTEEGKEQIIRFLQPGDFYGDETIFNDEPLSYTVEALEPTKICALDGDELKKILAVNPQSLFKIIEQMSKRMHEVEKRLCTICHNDVGTRLAQYLLEHAPTLSVNKKDLASLLGTTRETISRKLTDFQNKQYIVVQGRVIQVVDPQALGKV